MPNEPNYDGLAARLIAALEKSGEEALDIAGNELRDLIIPEIPVGNPAVDPHPEYSLAEHVVVRRYGHYVSVAVEGPYAVKQHEAVHFHHPRGGHAKFVEAPAVIYATALTGILAGTVQKTFASIRARQRQRTTGL